MNTKNKQELMFDEETDCWSFLPEDFLSNETIKFMANPKVFAVVEGYCNEAYIMFHQFRSGDNYIIVDRWTGYLLTAGTRDSCVRVWNKTGSSHSKPLNTYSYSTS